MPPSPIISFRLTKNAFSNDLLFELAENIVRKKSSNTKTCFASWKLQILDGVSPVSILVQSYPVRMRLENINELSAHAGMNDLQRWLNNFKAPPKHVFLHSWRRRIDFELRELSAFKGRMGSARSSILGRLWPLTLPREVKQLKFPSNQRMRVMIVSDQLKGQTVRKPKIY